MLIFNLFNQIFESFEFSPFPIRSKIKLPRSIKYRRAEFGKRIFLRFFTYSKIVFESTSNDSVVLTLTSILSLLSKAQIGG